MEIPKHLSERSLRFTRGGINLMQKSHRWDKKIESIIKKFNRNLNFLKFKGIQEELRKWDKFSKDSNLSYLTNGSALEYFDGTNFESNGNKNVDTKIESKIIRKNQSQLEFENILLNDGGFEFLETEFRTNVGSYEDSIKKFEDIYEDKEKEENIKIPVNHDLLERIKSVKIKPMVKKDPHDLSIEALIEDLKK